MKSEVEVAAIRKNLSENIKKNTEHSKAMKPPMARMLAAIVAIATVLRSLFIAAQMDAVAAISITIPAHKGNMFQAMFLEF